MSYFINPPFINDKQPNAAPVVDYTNPLSFGLGYAYVPSNPRYDSVDFDITSITNPKYQARSSMVGALCNSTTTHQITSGKNTSAIGSGISGGNKRTVFVLFDITTHMNTTRGLFSMGNPSVAGRCFSVKLVGWDDVATVVLDTWGTTASVSSINFSGGQPNSIVANYDGATAGLYINGVFKSSGSVSLNTTDTALKLNCYSGGGTTSYIQGDYYLVLAWDRCLSAAEIKLLSDNPWQIFRAEQPYSFVNVPAGGGTSINATVDSFTFATHAASINAAHNINTVVDSFTFATHAANINAALNLSATVDSFTFSAHDATINTGTGIQATVDTFTFATHTANVNAGTNIQATADSFTFTEHDAAIGVGLNIDATVDSFTFTEHNATVRFDTKVNCTVQSFTFSTHRATIFPSTYEGVTIDGEQFKTITGSATLFFNGTNYFSIPITLVQ